MLGSLSKLFRDAVARVSADQLVEGAVRLPASLSGLDAAQRRRFEEWVILGVLLDHVAYADRRLSPEEEAHLKEAVRGQGATASEAALVLAAARESADARPDIQGFTREVNKRSYRERLEVIALLFGIAHADGHAAEEEVERIREISTLLWVEHKDFIDAKLKARDRK